MCSQVGPLSTTERRRRRDRRPNANARGYTYAHQQERKRWAAIVATGRVPCARCGRLIRPFEPFDLDHHDTDKARYLGPVMRRATEQPQHIALNVVR